MSLPRDFFLFFIIITMWWLTGAQVGPGRGRGDLQVIGITKYWSAVRIAEDCFVMFVFLNGSLSIRHKLLVEILCDAQRLKIPKSAKCLVHCLLKLLVFSWSGSLATGISKMCGHELGILCQKTEVIFSNNYLCHCQDPRSWKSSWKRKLNT